MPSRLVTIVLAVLSLGFGSLAAIHLVQDDLSSIFGSPPRPNGDELYQFDLNKVHLVTIKNSAGQEAVFRKQSGVWVMHEPVGDRADFRDLQRLVYFSRHLQVQGVLRRQDTSLEASGMRRTAMHGGRFSIKLTDTSGRQVAEYRLGRRTAWHHRDPESGEITPTFFVRPNEKSQKDYIYICAAPTALQPSLRQILDRGFDNLRDHRPFLFDPANLAEITIRQAGGTIVLARDSTRQPWRMAKPLESRTNPEMMAGLLKGLYELEAVKIHDAGEVTIPSRGQGDPYFEIQIRQFDAEGQPQEAIDTLTVHPPTAEGAETVYAIMEQSRPGVVLELPVEPAPGRFALRQLPTQVDQLRSRTLASLDIRALRSLTIHQLDLPAPVQLFLGTESRSGSDARRWMVNLSGESAPANEVALAELLQAVTRHEVVSFASDAARDLSAFGLAPPGKRLVLEGGENETIDLFFGRGRDGKFYAMRRGTPTVAEITAETFTSIAAQPVDWRDTLLMPFSIVDLTVMRREPAIQPPLQGAALVLNYSYLDESWTARQFGEDATPRLDTQRANQFIKFMENLRVDKWLDSDFSAARRALQNPTFRFTAIFRELDDFGDLAGLRESSFRLAPASLSPTNRYFYGQLDGDPHYFVIGLDTYQMLTAPLVEQQ